MSRQRPYRPAYKTSTPNPGGWLTLLIIVMVSCALCWPLTSGAVDNLLGSVGDAVQTVTQGSKAALTIAVSPRRPRCSKR